MRKQGPDCQIGTSGWNYKHWSGGRFYPPRLSAAKWLAYYAGHYHTVEVNSSYYSIPSAGSVEKWARSTPPGFTFALKLWRGITHYRKLHNCGDLLERFFASAGRLESRRRAPLLVQLPPNLGKDVGRLEEFFDALKSIPAAGRWRVAVEFRNASWLSDDAYASLDRRQACVVISDHPRCHVEQANDAGFVYIRRHGRNQSGAYTLRQIREDARRMEAWLKSGRAVYVYYNNDVGGHAIDNARQLMDVLGVTPPRGGEREPLLFER